MHAEDAVLRQAEIQEQSPAVTILGNVRNADLSAPPGVEPGDVPPAEGDHPSHLLGRNQARQRLHQLRRRADPDLGRFDRRRRPDRGGYRRGRIVWNWERRGGLESLFSAERPSDFLDWEVIVCHPEMRENFDFSKAEIPTVVWQPAPLKAEEEETTTDNNKE